MVNHTKITSMIHYVDDPDVAHTLANTKGFNWNAAKLAMEPSHALNLIKSGKAPAAEAIAKVAHKRETLDKLIKDRRKGVRHALAGNENLTDEDRKVLLDRALKYDEDSDIADRIIPRMEPQSFLEVAKGHLTEVCLSTDAGPLGYNEIRLSPKTVHRLIPQGGREFVQGLAEQQMFGPFLRLSRSNHRSFHPSADSGVEWYEPGMLSWILPELPADLASELAYNMLSAKYPLNVDDMEAARRANDEAPLLVDGNRDRRDDRLSRMDGDVARMLLEMGSPWELLVERAMFVPEDVELQLLEKSKSPANEMIPGLMNRSGSVTADLINQTAEYLIPSVEETNLELRANLHPSDRIGPVRERASLAYMARLNMMQRDNGDEGYLSVLRGLSTRGVSLMVDHVTDAISSDMQHPSMAAITLWARGECGEVPTAESVEALLENITDSRVRVGVVEYLATHIPEIEPVLGKPLEILGVQALNSAEMTAKVFTHYFRNNTEAWQTAMDMAPEWEGSIEDLAATACIANDVPLPGMPEEEADEPEAEAEESSDEEDVASAMPSTGAGGKGLLTTLF